MLLNANEIFIFVLLFFFFYFLDIEDRLRFFCMLKYKYGFDTLLLMLCKIQNCSFEYIFDIFEISFSYISMKFSK